MRSAHPAHRRQGYASPSVPISSETKSVRGDMSAVRIFHQISENWMTTLMSLGVLFRACLKFSGFS